MGRAGEHAQRSRGGQAFGCETHGRAGSGVRRPLCTSHPPSSLLPYPSLRMNSATRYAQLLPTHVRERMLIDTPAEWSEIELQAHWFAGDFGRDFRAVTGESVRIVQF